jgi:hypothetical protein
MGIPAQRLFRPKKSRDAEISDISASRLSRGDPWAFRPTLANGLVLSCITRIVYVCAGRIIEERTGMINKILRDFTEISRFHTSTYARCEKIAIIATALQAPGGFVWVMAGKR